MDSELLCMYFCALFSSFSYDQANNCCPEPFTQAQLLRNASVEIYAVAFGTGKNIIWENLYKLTGSSERVFQPEEYE